ncbi:DUF4337 domain-containing protein [Hyphomicrobium sp.]|uniref:DUF4337 domain-containing protein n=1 Tax=Hyphomicrobium sp. TaxID=82 RepID=UPI0025B9C6A9|nr:DUF4337 domain-containing protein [Hyphomicrobium sp.]MCC7253529.1 DUF4337 domain-containing protein [Hyphomicrobium sp.]
MAFEDLGREAAESRQRRRDRWIGVYIGVLAVILAVCAMGGGNAAKDANRKNVEATNIWGFFQAKNMRRHTLRLQVDELELQLANDASLSEPARAAIRAKIESYRELDKELTSNPKSNEGLDELFHRGKALEAERDIAASKDPYFDYGQALLQIAIVLASVAIISGGTAVLVASILVGIVGALMTLNGFTLLLSIPFIG